MKQDIESSYLTNLSAQQIASRLGFNEDLRSSLYQCHCICKCKNSAATYFQSFSRARQLGTLFDDLRNQLRDYHGTETDFEITITLKAIYTCSSCQKCITKHGISINRCRTVFNWKRQLRHTRDETPLPTDGPYSTRQVQKTLKDWDKLSEVLGVPFEYGEFTPYIQCRRIYLCRDMTPCKTDQPMESFNHILLKLRQSVGKNKSFDVLDEHLHVMLAGLLCPTCCNMTGEDDRIVNLWKENIFGATSMANGTVALSEIKKAAEDQQPPPLYSPHA